MDICVGTLAGRWVCLEPMEQAHREGLGLAADDERIWRNFTTIARGPGFDAWFDGALALRDKGSQIPFAVYRLADGKLIGSTSYLEPNAHHRRTEIGATWYHPETWGTTVNPECKLLLLVNAFETWKMNRVQFVTDVRNEHSQSAITKLGATREGTLRSHMITQGGRIRDSALFSITVEEWPTVKERLTARLT